MIIHTDLQPGPRHGDLIGLHPANTAGADHRRTYRVADDLAADATYPIWHADLAAPGAADWAAIARPGDLRYLIRRAPAGLVIWRCPCCHPLG